MGLYSDLTVAEIREKIVEIRTAVETAVMGGEVEVISGEGRMMKARLLSISEAKGLIALLQEELTDPERTGIARRGRALGVRIDAR
jgi:hypothetical protein